MRLCVIGDSPDVRHYAIALVEQGHQVYWLASTEALRTLHNGPRSSLWQQTSSPQLVST